MFSDKLILIVLVVTTMGTPLTDECPEPCRCYNMTAKDISMECTSLNFLNRPLSDQITRVVKLDASSISLKTISPNLKIFKRLEILDISNNMISSVQIPRLPKLKHLNLEGNQIKDIDYLPTSLEYLDVSSNDISEITRKWTSLKNLKYLNLNNNPIDCTCETILYYNKLVEMAVTFQNPVKCSTPQAFRGKTLESLNCSVITDNLLNSMMGDQSPLDEDYILDSDSNVDIKSGDKENEEFEGSGDEGSGMSGIFEGGKENPLITCFENCSTLAPLGVNDESNASTAPSIPDVAKILYEDIVGKPKEDKSNIENEPTHQEDSIDKTVDINQQIPAREEIVSKNEKYTVDTEAKKNTPEEMERASVGIPTQNSNTTYFVLAGILIVFIALIAIVIIRKRSNNKRHKLPPKENDFYEEMKPLRANGRSEVPDEASTKIPEKVQLINEENSKAADKDMVQPYPQGVPKAALNESDIPKSWQSNQSSLPPDTLKVTIKASEIPDSVPKTPILIHRELNENGNYTTYQSVS